MTVCIETMRNKWLWCSACVADDNRWLPTDTLQVSCSAAHGMLRLRSALLQNQPQCIPGMMHCSLSTLVRRESTINPVYRLNISPWACHIGVHSEPVLLREVTSCASRCDALLRWVSVELTDECQECSSHVLIQQWLRSNILFKSQHEHGPTTHKNQQHIGNSTMHELALPCFDSNPFCSFKPLISCASPMNINQICFWDETYFIILNQLWMHETHICPRNGLFYATIRRKCVWLATEKYRKQH